MKIKKSQQGMSILILLLGAAVLSATLASMLAGGSGIASMSSSMNAISTTAAQASLIRSKILQCAIEYPMGDNATSYRKSYPGGALGASVDSLVCPGSAQNLWSMNDGIAMPTVTAGFGQWQYANDATSMRILITSTTSDRTAILQSIANKLGTQASVTGATLTWVIAL